MEEEAAQERGLAKLRRPAATCKVSTKRLHQVLPLRKLRRRLYRPFQYSSSVDWWSDSTSSPHGRVVSREHILFVLAGHGPHLRSLDDPAVCRVLDHLLGLAQSEARIQRVHRGPPCHAVLVCNGLLAILVQLLLLPLMVLPRHLRLRRSRLQVDLVASGFGIPGEDLRLRQLHGIPLIPNEVVAGVHRLGGIQVRQRVLSHGARLGIVVRRVGVQVQQVLGLVLAQAKVSHGGGHLRSAEASLAGDPPLEVFLLVILCEVVFLAVALLAVVIRVRVGLGIGVGVVVLRGFAVLRSLFLLLELPGQALGLLALLALPSLGLPLLLAHSAALRLQPIVLHA
eukprot:scaffold2448_cov250-Pinguiococcus_pyrenoidosus.AAC.19